MLFDAQVRPHGDWTVVAVVGEVDLASSPRLRSVLAGVVAAPAPLVLLDLRAVDFLDSSGLGVLIGALRRIRAANGTLRIVVQAPHVRRVFDLTGLDRILELYDDEVAALTAPVPDAPTGAALGTPTLDVETGR